MGDGFAARRTWKDLATARKRFAREGCALFETSHNDPPDSETAVRSGALFALLGDDIDGIASLMAE